MFLPAYNQNQKKYDISRINLINQHIKPVNPIIPPVKQTKQVMEESSEGDIDLDYIIENKPKAKIVREFLSSKLSCIKNPDDLLFE
jgi:hypothetical protein